jgi:hypothetical protein
VYGPRKGAFHAHCTGFQRQRADEARSLAERMSDETAKQTMLMVAKDYDSFGVRATTRSIDELFVRRIIDETKAS